MTNPKDLLTLAGQTAAMALSADDRGYVRELARTASRGQARPS